MSERFARQELVAGWSQARLRESSVVIVGIGALGSEVARLLAMAGVGRLILCDHDIVERSNLSRGVLFRDDDVSRFKAEVAAGALIALAPDTTVVPRVARHVHGVGLTELRDASLVVSCLDSREARLQLMGRCALVSSGMLNGGTRDWGGEVAWYAPGGPCFGCGLSSPGRAAVDGAVSCLGTPHTFGASGAVSALVGSLMAVFALRLLMGAAVTSEVVSIDAAGGGMTRSRLTGDPDCPLHERIEPADVTALPVSNDAPLADLLSLVGPGETLFSWASIPDGGLVLDAARASATLAQLGVPSGELLPVVSATRTRYFELARGAGLREAAIG